MQCLVNGFGTMLEGKEVIDMNIQDAQYMVWLDRTLETHEQKIDFIWKVLNCDEILREIQRKQQEQIEKVNVNLSDVNITHKPEQEIQNIKKQEKKNQVEDFVVKGSVADAAVRLMKLK